MPRKSPALPYVSEEQLDVLMKQEKGPWALLLAPPIEEKDSIYWGQDVVMVTLEELAGFCRKHSKKLPMHAFAVGRGPSFERLRGRWADLIDIPSIVLYRGSVLWTIVWGYRSDAQPTARIAALLAGAPPPGEPTTADDWAFKAEQFLSWAGNDRYEKAEAAVHKALALKPGHRYALEILAQSYSNQGNEQRAGEIRQQLRAPKGKRPAALTVERFGKALEAYCRAALREATELGKPEHFEITWADGAFWCCAYNLTWSAEVNGETHCAPAESSLDIPELDIKAIAALRSRNVALDRFFVAPDTNESRFGGDAWVMANGGYPEGEYGLWLRHVFAECISETSDRLAADPQFEGLGFSIHGHDTSSGRPTIDDKELAALRQGYCPSGEFLSELFAFLSSDATRCARWLALAAN